MSGFSALLVGMPQRVQDRRLSAAEGGDRREPEQDDHRDGPPEPAAPPPAPGDLPAASPCAHLLLLPRSGPLAGEGSVVIVAGGGAFGQ